MTDYESRLRAMCVALAAEHGFSALFTDKRYATHGDRIIAAMARGNIDPDTLKIDYRPATLLVFDVGGDGLARNPDKTGSAVTMPKFLGRRLTAPTGK